MGNKARETNRKENRRNVNGKTDRIGQREIFYSNPKQTRLHALATM